MAPGIIAERDGLDEYDDEMMDAVFRDLDAPSKVIPIRKSTDDIASQNATANLGIDKEITITKKRQPTAKLDISRLLSPAGIPKLRKISKDRLKFRGKGHEFTDVARLLNTYQLWLDDLYPRAKFADGLLMIEKLGHSKQLQIMRKQWIDEGKPIQASEDEDVEKENNEDISRDGVRSPEPLVSGALDPGMDGDRSTSMQDKNADINGIPSAGPDEDELDALLAEDTWGNDPTAVPTLNKGFQSAQSPPSEENFDDEMGILASMDDPW